MKNKYTINIVQDIEPSNPRTEWDNLGHLICFHRRYNLGDKHNETIESLNEIIKRKDVVSLPIYLFDHSGITIATKPFSCRFDSGQVGYIYITKNEYIKEFGGKNINRKKALLILQSEVETYNQYIIGDVHGYEIIDNDTLETIDSCYGFYGVEDAQAEAENTVKYLNKRDLPLFDYGQLLIA